MKGGKDTVTSEAFTQQKQWSTDGDAIVCTALHHRQLKASLQRFVRRTTPLAQTTTDVCNGLFYRNCPACGSTLAYPLEHE